MVSGILIPFILDKQHTECLKQESFLSEGISRRRGKMGMLEYGTKVVYG
jgi:hypothetical protein